MHTDSLTGNQSQKTTKILYSNIEDMTTPNLSISGKEMTENMPTSLHELMGARKESTILYMSTDYRELENKTITSTPEKYNSIVTEDAAELVTKDVEDTLTEEHLKKEPSTYKKTMMPVIDSDEKHITKSDKDGITLSNHNETSENYPTTQKYLSSNHSKDFNNDSLLNTMNVMEKNTIDVDIIDAINTVTINTIDADSMDTIDTVTSDTDTNNIGSRTTIETMKTIEIEDLKTLNTNEMNTASTPAVNAVYASARNTDDAGAMVDTGILNTVVTQDTIGTGVMHTSDDITENTVNTGSMNTIDKGTKVTESGSINTIETDVMNTVDPYSQISTIIPSTHDQYTEPVSLTKQKNNPTASIDAVSMQTISAWEMNTNDDAIQDTFEAGEINTNDPSDIGTFDAGNMSTIDKDVIYSSIVNRYNSTYKQMSTDDTPSITDPYTSEIFSSKQTKNPTVSEVNEEYEATATGKQTSVSTTQDIDNDKKLTESASNSTKDVDSIQNTNFSKFENVQSIEVTNDNLDKMTGSTKNTFKDQFNTITHMGNTKTDNQQSKYSQEVLTTSNNSEETEDQSDNYNSESDLISTPIIGELSRGVPYKTTQYYTEKNTANKDIHKTNQTTTIL